MSASVSLAQKPFWQMGSSPVKMSQAFHDPSISFDLLQLFVDAVRTASYYAIACVR